LLKKRGLMVDVASSGVEAVRCYEQSDYAVILMDCQMPLMDGYDATRDIRRKEQGGRRYTPVIAITAHAMGSERDRCRAAGMDDYLTKPVEPAALLRCIAAHHSVSTAGVAPQHETHKASV